MEVLTFNLKIIFCKKYPVNLTTIVSAWNVQSKVYPSNSITKAIKIFTESALKNVKYFQVLYCNHTTSRKVSCSFRVVSVSFCIFFYSKCNNGLEPT